MKDQDQGQDQGVESMPVHLTELELAAIEDADRWAALGKQIVHEALSRRIPGGASKDESLNRFY